MPDIVDDKSEIVIPFILSRLKQHRAQHDTPFFIGLNGVQGVGKTTLVTALQKTLSSPPHSHPTLTISIDDFYLDHDSQRDLATRHPSNPLVQHRGQPSTHNVDLGLSTFRKLKAREPNVGIPAYDKSAFEGAGTTISEDKWQTVNKSGDASIDVVVFEGWCVGFRPLSPAVLEQKWRAAVHDEQARKERGEDSNGRLGLVKLEDVAFVNESLRSYDSITDHLDAFVFLDAEDTQYVYDWRLEAERKLRKEKGSGMSDEKVKEFVDGYYSAYELYTEDLRIGAFADKGENGEGRQLRLQVGQDRTVIYDETI